MRTSMIAAVCVAALLVACGGDAGGANTSPMPTPGPVVTSATVAATPAIQFTPAIVNLAVGGTIEFDFGSVPHNVYFDDAPPGAPANITAPSFSTRVDRTFLTPGRYVYNCHLHPGMSGVIVVQ
jgi:plastocyanin